MKRTTIAFLCLALIPAIAAAQQRVALREGLIIHPTRAEGYVMVPGGVAAVDLNSGAVLWQSNAAAKPLALNGNTLVSQVEPDRITNRLQLVALDVRERGAVRARNSIALPEGVQVSVGESPLGAFIATGRPGDGTVIVTWQYVPRNLRGRDDDIEEKRASAASAVRRPAQGAVRINVATGAMTRMDTAAMTPPASSSWALTSRSRPSSASSKSRQFESADQRHLLASERIADDREFRKYRWTIFDEAGTRLGEIRSHIAFAPFVVRDNVLVFETTPYAVAGHGAEPAKLHGVDLATGAERWSLPVREVAYRGPLDP